MSHYINPAWVKANVIQKVLAEFNRHVGYTQGELTQRLFATGAYPAPFPGKRPTRIVMFKMDSLGRVIFYYLGNKGRFPECAGTHHVVEFDRKNIVRLSWGLGSSYEPPIRWVSIPLYQEYYPLGFRRKVKCRPVYLAAVRHGVYVPRVLLAGITNSTTIEEIHDRWTTYVQDWSLAHANHRSPWPVLDSPIGEPIQVPRNPTDRGQHYRLFPSQIRDTNGYI